MNQPVHRVGVVGAGLMGSGIAEVCARAGLDVLVFEIDAQALAAGRERVERSLARAVRGGRLGGPERDKALGRLRWTTDLSDFADRELVLEAVAESERIKTEVFARLDRVVEDPDAILASNSSSIPMVKLATATSRPDRVIGVHFFNPVPVLPLVELVPSLLTAERTAERAEAFVTGVLGKRVIRAGDRAGFVVNALLVPYLLSAIRMLESGFASAADIDQGMVQGCAHPLGPLALADLIGLDTVQAIAESMYQEYKEPLYSPPPLLARMVQAGLLGRKSGRGFHDYAAAAGAAGVAEVAVQTT
ncbi:3-hydroxybutyryl-CoA dehydrogenase [Streptacidiphilus anmyonensis]|uniref:3-hydroxybutyryl-CoA dehydrogenase n=1 Tax=Streptacidiphilus anmyonensis TaxID=405782 RepID=UPI0005A617CA|nr:3-hydroxybutyryl-CoA dehydrogenase [Streptacidiphilus anmyonensis]